MNGDSSFDAALFGEAMLLLVADEAGPLENASVFHKCTAGAETNVAIGLARWVGIPAAHIARHRCTGRPGPFDEGAT